MARSMTGYARARSKEIDVELSSVNRKGLDIHSHLNRELLSLDMEIRKSISKVIHRGKIAVKIRNTKGEESLVSLSLLKKLKSGFTKIAKELKLSPDEITLPFLLQQMDRSSLEEEVSAPEVKKTLTKALQDLIKMKETEGKALAQDITKRLKILSASVSFMEKENAKSPENHRKKLTSRLKELFEEAGKDERILKEIALFSEKVDITEEITRLKSHFKQMQDLLSSKEESVGRTLEFLTQEMLREINTIGSKTAALSVTKKVIDAKAELEKIREQVQNIE
ncbi:MAG: YicC family protein [Simkaniaceae bacterium]|nr:YicC family protein [Candidatus Sacchlamyda saccharinae]